ncbi:hypothetical protein H5410_045617 [Solanum commersonii]|uniref:Uncharacterized protein n=1 Tax=Solanum commersonii TaxID=4109 RepID=A0A9J5XC57_SOLCO|nr:hypothetical protein H5410_045617 [Solanum commersonii]
MNVKEEISENEENESFDDKEWDDNENETTEDEEWENDGIETSEEKQHREHLEVIQTKQAKKEKSTRRPIDPEDIPGSISSTPELRASSTSHALPPWRYEDLHLLAIHRPRPLCIATPSATLDNQMLALAPGQKDRLGRFMIELMDHCGILQRMLPEL